MSLQNSHDISSIKVMLKKGADGDSITSIEKTGTSGLVDTYTITLNTGAKYTFTVTNGKSIVSIEKTATVGLVDTYTITYNDGSTDTFDVTNGKDMEPDVSAIVNVYSSKNFAPYPYLETTKTFRGITYTDNGDGTISASGTVNNPSSSTFALFDVQLKKGSYILSGCPEGGSDNSYFIQFGDGTSVWREYGNEVLFTLDTDTLISAAIYVKPNTVISTPITFEPMIRDARISDPTRVPYAMTNRELTEAIKNKVYCDTITVTFSSGACNIARSTYPDVLAIIPGGISGDGAYVVTLNTIDDTNFKFYAFDKTSGSWASGTISFLAIFIRK